MQSFANVMACCNCKGGNQPVSRVLGRRERAKQIFQRAGKKLVTCALRPQAGGKTITCAACHRRKQDKTMAACQEKQQSTCMVSAKMIKTKQQSTSAACSSRSKKKEKQ